MSYKSYTDYQANAASNEAYVRSAAPMASFGEAVCRAYRKAKAKVHEFRSIQIVSALEDHTLRDIGVHRSEIHYLAAKMAENPGVDYRVLRQ